MDRILGPSQAGLVGAMTFLASYALGTFTAVMDYMDTVDGEPIPATACSHPKLKPRAPSPRMGAWGFAMRRGGDFAHGDCPWRDIHCRAGQARS
jgi:hypothetical protein